MRINVAYWVDEQFTKHVYVSLFSILINMDSKDNLYCYLFTDTPNKYVPIIKSLEKLFKNFKLNIISVNETNMNKIQVSWELQYLNSATYYRFWINLIEWIEKIIYLDSDIIVNSNISELYQQDLDKKIIGACSDMPGDFVASYIGELWLNKKRYFNAGVLLINLKKWKEFQVSERCINLLKERTYKFNDQDVLNITLKDNIQWLPWSFNVLSWYFPEDFGEFRDLGFDRNYYEDAIKSPKIVHYTWAGKPWKLLPSHPLRYVYWKNFWKWMSIEVVLKWQFFRECFVVFIHDVEDFLFSYNMQKKSREKIRILHYYFESKLKKK